ncbi:MAG: alpha/beta hydrolase [Cellulosilyticaceae bacterium]
MKKRYKILGGVIIVVVTIILVGIGYGANFFYDLALNPKASKDMVFSSNRFESGDEVKQSETSGLVTEADLEWFANESGYKEIWRTSREGLQLHNYVLNTEGSHKWIIAVHGYTSQGVALSPYAKKFKEMGYNVLIPDLRGHGQSEGDYIGMGWDERLDILDLIDYVIAEDSDSEIALFGISMGAATVMNVSGEKLPPHVKAVIEDCGYTSVWDQFAYQLETLFGLTEFPMMHTASVITKIRAGYWLQEASPLEQIKKSITPTLFIHGREDAFVPYSMLESLYEVAQMPKQKLVIEGAGHARSRIVAPELYWDKITTFLNEYMS